MRFTTATLALLLRARAYLGVLTALDGEHAVERVHVRLGGRHDDVGVGAAAEVTAATALDADGHFTLGVDPLGDALDVKYDPLRWLGSKISKREGIV